MSGTVPESTCKHTDNAEYLTLLTALAKPQGWVVLSVGRVR